MIIIGRSFRAAVVVALACIALVGGGCGSAPSVEETARPALTSSARITRTPNAGGEAACDLGPIYFGYDSSTLSPEARDDLQASVQCAKRQERESLRITGMADPRGTEEYNLALGDRRATSVKQFVTALGMSEDTVQTHSTGEEFARGQDDASWAQDRRATIE
jgi:peptidoglycan-associated lipoprotein